MNKKFDTNIENRFVVKTEAPLYKQATGVDKLERDEDFIETEPTVILKSKKAKKKSEPKTPKDKLKNPTRCGLMLTDKQLNDLGILHVKKKETIAKMIREALEDYLLNYKDEPIEKEFIENTTLRVVIIEKNFYKALRTFAIDKEVAISDVGRKAVQLYLTKKNTK